VSDNNATVYLEGLRLEEVILCKLENRFPFAVYKGFYSFHPIVLPSRSATTWRSHLHRNRANYFLDTFPVNLRNLRS